MKINKLIITLIAAAFIFMGCSNSLDSAPSASGTYSVTGKISFASSNGAAPVIFTQDSEGRTATASFNNAHLSLKLYAYKYNEEGRLQTNKKYDNVVVDQSGYFVFCFEEKGFYILCADLLKDGIKSGTGFTEVEVTGYTPNTINIVTNPVITEDGKIQLNVSAATDITPQIKKVSVSWIRSVTLRLEDDVNPLDPTGEQHELEIRRKDSVQDGKYNKSFDVINGTATISYDNFPGGNWLAKISFEDETGNSLYSCQEIINVYPGFTTNRWYGSTPALNNGNFKITKNMVTNYDGERVPTFNNILLWNYSEWNEGNDMKGTFYYLLDENNIGNFVAPTVEGYEDLPYGADVYSKFSTNTLNAFEDTFFDADGNIYLALYSSDAPSPGSGITSGREGWNHVSWDNLGFRSIEAVKGFAVDYKTNIVYAIDKVDGAKIYKYPNMISSNGVTATPVDMELDLTSVSEFCVYDNIAYVLKEPFDGEYEISSFDLNSENSTIPVLKTISFDLDYVIGSERQSDAVVSDMLYQDGAIYLLYRERIDNFSSDMYNRGAVICINLDDGSTKYTGLTSNKMDKSKFRLRAFTTKLVYDIPQPYPLFTDEDLTQRMIPEYYDDNGETKSIEELLPNIYTPADNEICFFGPTKFVAVKPKKLVISDEGLAFYMNDGELYCKNVNRIVYVDLGTFAISSIENVDSSVSLNVDYEQPYLSSASILVPDNYSPHYYGSNEHIEDSCYYLGIINGDYE